MGITSLWVQDFRCFEEALLEPDPSGLTVLQGPNGAGKTSLLEAIGWLATLRSFRGAGRDAMVRSGQPRAVLRAELHESGRRVDLEGELPAASAARVQVNRQVGRRRSDLASTLRVTVFSPDALQLFQGGPAPRRDLLDDLLGAATRRGEVLLAELERVLRQRTALLRQAGGRLSGEVEATLDVWDSRLAATGEQVAAARQQVATRLEPLVDAAYRELARDGDAVTLTYRPSWEGSLADALVRNRLDDLRRQVTGVGPHRDELDLAIGTRPARTQASQGEQRSLALALRLASHELATADTGRRPLLLLDDVFSELDPARAEALVGQLPSGQVLLSTASAPPPSVSVDRVVAVGDGELRPLGRAS